MKIGRKDFLIQVRYADLLSDKGSIDKYFLGFGGELYLSTEELESYDTRLINNIKSFTKANHLPLRLHGPIPEIDYSRIQDTISRAKPLYEKVREFCKEMGINSVVAHAEFNYHTDFPIDKQLENAVSLWSVLCNELSRANIYINIENHCETEPDCLIGLMEKVNSPYLGMCVDIGHTNAFSELGIKKWLKKYPIGSIKELHLADNEGDGDTHLALGEGNIDFANFFKTFAGRGENPVFVLEPRNLGEAEKSLSFLRKAGLIE